MRPRIEISASPQDADREAIVDGLMAFNEDRGGPSGFEVIALLLKDDEGKTLGGLWGRITYGWLFVELLFVPEALRGLGLGSDLLEAAERHARDRACVGMWLDTHDFQAPDFYRARGYEVFGRLDDHARGKNRQFFRKLLAAER
jgi:GNAT superfamily N-acetyltransferase